jgi:Mitochondrial ATP synthase epsilon chain
VSSIGGLKNILMGKFSRRFSLLRFDHLATLFYYVTSILTAPGTFGIFRFRLHIFRLFSVPKTTGKSLKMSAWRAAGLNYINYSNIAARMLRNALKPEFRKEAVKRGE